MANYELYLIVLLFMGAVILSAFVCIWVILSTSKFGKEHRLLSIPSQAKEPAGGAPATEPELEEAESPSVLEVEEKLVESTLPQKLEISLEGTRGNYFTGILQGYDSGRGKDRACNEAADDLAGVLEGRHARAWRR